MRDDFELTANEKLKKDIKRLESAARQSSQWADKVESTKMGKGAAATRKKGHTSIDTRAYNAEKSRRMQIEELITTFKPTMIFVEHDRVFCENVGTKTVYLSNF